MFWARAKARSGWAPQKECFSFSQGRRWTATGVLTSRRGPDEGSLPAILLARIPHQELGTVEQRGPYPRLAEVFHRPPAATVCARRMAGFGVREIAPALSTADLSAVDAPRRAAASKSGDESPHSKTPLRIDLVRSSG